MPLMDVKEENKKRLDILAVKLAGTLGVKSVSYDEVIGFLLERYLEGKI